MAMIDPCREHRGMADSRCSAELRSSYICYNSTRMCTNCLTHPSVCRPFYCPGRSFHCHGSDLLLQPSLSNHSCYKVHVVSRNAYYLSTRINALIACSLCLLVVSSYGPSLSISMVVRPRPMLTWSGDATELFTFVCTLSQPPISVTQELRYTLWLLQPVSEEFLVGGSISNGKMKRTLMMKI
jgi:hypothetical protein